MTGEDVRLALRAHLAFASVRRNYAKTCSAGYVFRALEKEEITFIKSVIVINLQILLLEYIFCNFILLVICRDFISHTILRNVNTGIKKLLL